MPQSQDHVAKQKTAKLNPTNWIQRFSYWLRCPPSESDLFGVHIRETVQVFCKPVCEWEFRTPRGEEEHGKDFSRRYCTKCGKCQHAFYHRFGDVRVQWEDTPA